jgi:hypothetical protein
MNSCILPLGIKNRTKTELPALIALEAIGQAWFTEGHRCDLMSIALVSQLISQEGSDIRAASSELLVLLEQDKLDIETLRPVVVPINAWIQKQPNCRVQTAIDRLLGRKPTGIKRRSYG